MTIEYELVASLGLDKTEKIGDTYSINERSLIPCLFGHHWIHGMLEWNGQLGGHFKLTEGEVLPSGSQYHGAKFCLRCKKIECIHLLEKPRWFREKTGKYNFMCARIATCRLCGVRFVTQAHTLVETPERGRKIVEETAVACGKDPRHLPSGYWTHLPIQVEDICESMGEEAARLHAKSAFTFGVQGPY